jgi:hypothetical protein
MSRRLAIKLSPARCRFPIDLSQDLVSVVCGRSLVEITAPRRLRGIPMLVFFFGAFVPTVVLHVMTWMNEPGKFAFTAERPLWLDIWLCVGYSAVFGFMLLYMWSLQRTLFLLALAESSTQWCIIMSAVAIGGNVSALSFGGT